MEPKMTVKLERYDKNCQRLLVNGEIVGFALQLADGRWGLFDSDDNRLTKLAFRTPQDVAAAMDRRLEKQVRV